MVIGVFFIPFGQPSWVHGEEHQQNGHKRSQYDLGFGNKWTNHILQHPPCMLDDLDNMLFDKNWVAM